MSVPFWQACGATRVDQRWSFVNGSLHQGQTCLVWDSERLFLGECDATVWTSKGSELEAAPGMCLLVDHAQRGRGHGAAVSVGTCGSLDGRSNWNFTASLLISELKGSSSVWLSFGLEPLAVGAVLVVPPGHNLSIADTNFLATMRNMTKRLLSDYSTHWSGNLPQTFVAQKNSGPVDGDRLDMVKIGENECGSWEFRVTGMELEGEDIYGVDVQYPWEKAAQRSHSHVFSMNAAGTLPPFYIDKHLVTNRDYSRFVNSSGYIPVDTNNYLKHWGHNTTPPISLALNPVVWVSRQDAESYCAFHGKRLPEEWEWQRAAQGCDQRLYPWGNATPVYGSHVPPLVPGRQDYNTSPVGAFPQGASASGLLDLAGNVWQWTSLFEDAHTRGAILRGGTVFRPGVGGTGDSETTRHDVNYMWFGDWYFPGGADTIVGPQPWGIEKYPEAFQLQYHAKLLMMSPALDRSGAIGFRCAAATRDAPTEPSPVHWAWILVPIGALLLSALCIGGLFYQRTYRHRLRKNSRPSKTPLLKAGDVSLPGESSYRSLGGYDADVSGVDPSTASGSIRQPIT